MSKKTINVSYWKQSTGRTGQCLTERGQKLFDTTSALYTKVTGKKLSKERVYDLCLNVCRAGRQEEGFYIQSTAPTSFMLLMQDLATFCRAELKGYEYKEMTFGQFKTKENLSNLATAKVGRKGKVA